MKKFSWPRHSVLIIAIVATWITTYIGYITSFNMKIDNRMQEFILFLNPLSFLLFVYGTCAIHEKYEETEYLSTFRQFINIYYYV